jgi:hypothetical protein
VCGDALWRWGLRGACTALAASAHGAEVGESGWAWHGFPPMGPAARMRKWKVFRRPSPMDWEGANRSPKFNGGSGQLIPLKH